MAIGAIESIKLVNISYSKHGARVKYPNGNEYDMYNMKSADIVDSNGKLLQIIEITSSDSVVKKDIEYIYPFCLIEDKSEWSLF